MFFRWGVTPRLFERLRATVDPNEGFRVEQVLASARAFLGVSALIAIWLDPTEPARHPALTYTLLALYALHSVTVLAWLHDRQRVTPALCLGLHLVDIIWPAIISLFTAGPNSPFFIFNVFVLLAAAYRWGLQETLMTAGLALMLFIIEAAVEVFLPPSVRAVLGDFTFNRILMRGVYLLMTGYLLGFLAEQEKRWRAEATGIAAIIGRIQREIGMRAALRAALEETRSLFGALRALFVLQETSTRQTSLWEVVQGETDSEASLEGAELDTDQRSAYLFEAPGEVWFTRRGLAPGDGAPNQNLILDAAGKRVDNNAWVPPQDFLNALKSNQLLAASVVFGTEWAGRLFLLEPSPGCSRVTAARFLQAFVRQLSPVLNSVLLSDRLRSHAGAAERARVARELHDGVIQSLIALEMEVSVLRQHPPDATLLPEELSRIQQLLHHEVLSLRELIQQMKAMELGPRQLLEYLASTVDKFGRDTGIAARFVSPLEDVRLPPHFCGELARILQEGLTNVRRHSGARNVVVRFEVQDGFWKLVIDDDGRGFDFSGRLGQGELDTARKGPVVIKERVRALGGALSIESLPGRGARLEILVPQKNHG
ncbi:MAG: hypothetical protein LAP13_08955 [Acidobacteriia bacterium]|nr:hypothetical protein [Terriglobia bacterium]